MKQVTVVTCRAYESYAKKKVNKQTKRKLQYSVLVPYKEGPLSGSTTEVISVGQVQDLKFLPLPHMEA